MGPDVAHLAREIGHEDSAHALAVGPLDELRVKRGLVACRSGRGGGWWGGWGGVWDGGVWDGGVCVLQWAVRKDERSRQFKRVRRFRVPLSGFDGFPGGSNAPQGGFGVPGSERLEAGEHPPAK